MHQESSAGALRCARQELCVTQLRLARACRLSVETVARLERGQTPSPRLGTVAALADALGLDLERLVRDGQIVFSGRPAGIGSAR